jgi:ligand-binding sensor domain-containing protein
MGRPDLMRAILLALLFFQSAVAEEISGRFLVRTWQSEDGLPSNAVRGLAQSADGYLWVATAEGLARFDGVRFSGFGAEAQTSLAGREPRRILALGGGDVWVTTARGGLLRWQGGRLQSVWNDLETGSRQAVQITRLISDGADGLLIVRPGEVWRARGTALPERLENSPALETRRQEELEIHHEQAAPSAGGPVLRDRAGRVWTVSAGGGLSVTDPAGGIESVALPMLGPANRISQLFEDREGNLWVATGEIGLVQIRARRVEVLTAANGLTDRAAAVVLADRSGAVWIGSKSGGLDRMRGGAVEHFGVGEGGPVRLVSALYEAANGTIWAATRNGSVFRFEGGAFQTTFRAGTGPSKVAAITGDGAGRVWFGGINGLTLYENGQLTHFGGPGGPPPTDISALARDARGTLWIGTSKGALFTMHKGVPVRIAGPGDFAGFGISAF